MPNTVNNYIETDLGNVSPNPRGEYNATYDYEYLDMVYYKGGSYVCLVPLGETISNVSPIVGQTSTNWQCVAIPGDITPEYTSMYDEVVKDYNETNTNTADVALMKQNTHESMTAAQESERNANTSEVNAHNSEVSAKQSMDKAKEYSDEAIRVNNDTQSLVTGFDEHVATAILNAKASISESTDNSKEEIITQKNNSLNDFRSDAETVITNEKNVAIAEIHQMVDNFSTDVSSKKQEVIQVADEKINTMTSINIDVVNAKNAAETAATTATNKAKETSTYASNAKSSSDSAKANADLVSADKIEISNMKSDVESKVNQFESDIETYNISTLRSDMTELQKETSDGFNELKSDLFNISDDVSMIAPSVEKSESVTVTENDCEYLGNYIISANGALSSNENYFAYKFKLPYNGRWHMNNLGYSSYGFLGVYHGEPSTETFDNSIGRKLGSSTNDWDFNLEANDCVILSVNLLSTIHFNMLYEYEYIAYPTLFVHDMNVAWFGDSISQLQLLPHRVAEYMGITVNDCSFAGAPLTYGTEAYQGTGFMSLTSQIVSKDFTELENSLSKQNSVSEDKRGNADRLEALDFSAITDIVVMAGTNDVNNDYVATSTDLTKFKNGMRTAINTIQNAYPQINLYFISNPYRGDVITDKHGNTLADFVNAEKEVCNEMNIPFYDLYHNSGINANTIGYYLMSDKLHQNENGDILMAKKIAKWLMSN